MVAVVAYATLYHMKQGQSDRATSHYGASQNHLVPKHSATIFYYYYLLSFYSFITSAKSQRFYAIYNKTYTMINSLNSVHKHKRVD